MSSKIKTIAVANLKAVASLAADFNGCTAIITGGNNKGKTTFLRGIVDRIRGIKPDQIVKQGEKEGFAEVVLTTGERFVWKFNNTTKQGEKLTFISERNIPGSVTKELASYYFPKVFDVDEFLQAAPAKQRATLQKLSGIDFSEFDKMYKAAYEDRTYRNKAMAEEKAKASFVDPTLPKEEIPTEDLDRELLTIDNHNARYENAKVKVSSYEQLVDQNIKEIDRLMALVEELGEKNATYQLSIDAGNEWLDLEANKPKTEEDKIAIAEKLNAAKKKNEAIRENLKAVEQDKKIDAAIKAAEAADKEVKRLEAEKADVIKNSSLPDGFGFTDEGITYKGFEFSKEQLSSSGLYIAALKLAALGLGEVKTLHFDASYLTRKSLEEVEAWANANDLQLLIERPDWEDGEIEYQIIHN